MSSSYTARLRRVQQYVNGNDLGQPIDTNGGSVTAMKRVACNNCVSSGLLGPFSSGPRVMNTAAVINLKVNMSGVDPVVKLSPHDDSGDMPARLMRTRKHCGNEGVDASGNTCLTTNTTCNTVKNMNVQSASTRTRKERDDVIGEYLRGGPPTCSTEWQRTSKASLDRCF